MAGGDHRESGGQEWPVLAPISIHNCDLEDVIGFNCKIVRKVKQLSEAG